MNKVDRLIQLEQLAALQREKSIRAARDNFFEYCHLKAPDFYKRDRAYLVDFCNKLQDFYFSKTSSVMIVNAPPRHGKSRTIGCFAEWIFGRNIYEKIMTGSYNDTLSTTFAKNVRNTIQEIKGDIDRVVYSDIFPDTKIKQGDGAMDLWSLDGGHNSFLATSPKGTATGFGATLMIIDDLIKNKEEAYNARILEAHYDWYVNTMLSRCEEGCKIIIVMTRWHTNDLAGRLMEKYPNAWLVIYEALQKDGTMLCPEILSFESYQEKAKLMGSDIVSANYQQVPIDIKGKLYTTLKTYDRLPTDANGHLLFTKIKNYTDTADTGDDYLCSVCYGVYNNEAYILDVIYTKEGMEKTEPQTAKMLYDNKVNHSKIESNNGGRGFARNVDKILKNDYGSNHCYVEWFYQSANKQARILSNSTWVMQHIYFPVNWKDRWAEFYDAITKYQKEGKNAHDDAPDVITGIAEEESNNDNWLY